ncbi:flagellar biosynthesis/type III secretory pathway chaperone [Cytobacillus eiseniae]|uniref:Flagellar biosynthesis/type III secretory pathway chaperone n=1 Tax=Cytobacillus eiseniae TaxID=762947 RepID=A0ABS4RGG6_9BACI|nr:flagellar protein FlgN [Cytobacillus eiseniae]MBP2241977.1 flagellar biosynthesis/type III secretory pathway chaperone [Cytobacillus eiseniae]
MSAEVLITSMEKLCKLHESLYDLAVKKTDIMKIGDMDTLNQLLIDEQTHIAAIDRMKKECQNASRILTPHIDQPTVSDCMDYLTTTEQEKIKEVTNELVQLVLSLKEQNNLNQQLIHNSLQFVNVSLSLLRPQPEEINYGPPTKIKKSSNINTQGMFSSKA